MYAHVYAKAGKLNIKDGLVNRSDFLCVFFYTRKLR